MLYSSPKDIIVVILTNLVGWCPKFIEEIELIFNGEKIQLLETAIFS
jgi:hypothetical protein